MVGRIIQTHAFSCVTHYLVAHYSIDLLAEARHCRLKTVAIREVFSCMQSENGLV